MREQTNIKYIKNIKITKSNKSKVILEETLQLWKPKKSVQQIEDIIEFFKNALNYLNFKQNILNLHSPF